MQNIENEKKNININFLTGMLLKHASMYYPSLVLQHMRLDMWQETRQCCTKLITLKVTVRFNAFWAVQMALPTYGTYICMYLYTHTYKYIIYI